MTKSATTLDDKYLQDGGRVFISSNQALVRLPLDQARRDAAAGLKTAGYISGYRGSPLGVYDVALWGAQKLLDAHHIRFVPGLNEELAVSGIRGTQELNWFGASQFEGVFGLWYGKGIGVDRACESLKLANFEGTSARGGVLVVAGDDHGGKSSDSAHQSEHTLIAAMVPVLYPATIGEIIEFGLFGWAMSRYSGCYVGLKCITDTLDLSGEVELPDPRVTYVTPGDVALPPEGLNLRPNLPPLVEEDWLVNKRLPAAQAFARANGIDRVVIDGERRTLSIVTAGKAYLDVRQALDDLGLDEARCRQLGIRVYKPGLIWPMDPQRLLDFAQDSRAVLVVEEKRALMEEQIARHLYDLPDARRPRIAGKHDLHGATLLPAAGELSVPQVRRALRMLLDQLGLSDDVLDTRQRAYGAIEAHAATVGSSTMRPAYFCSGCPHNTSTRIPDGSKALGGIGCHGLVAVVMDRNTMQFMPMGHEGSNWASVSAFVDTPHVFANMGDGTYSHSGILSIRASVAAKANITYKLLYNDAVAMTGGQPVEQGITPIDMVNQLLSEGVRPVKLVSDDPGKFRHLALPANASLHHRDEMDALQRELRDSPGVSAIVYEQTCAAEKRRRRKRKQMVDPDQRVFINPDVCEGCGDCSVQSNCLSVQPLETEFGRKRRIDQSNCNKDYSCLKGFCPSFVTVTGAKIAVRAGGDAARLQQLIAALPPAPVAAMDARGCNILVAGIGGTGVLTIGALLGMAAHLDRKGCTILDLTGMAQKGGAVTSHIRIGPDPAGIYSARLSEGMTDVLIACDAIVGAGATVLRTVRPGHTRAVLNTDVAPTGEFQTNKKLDLNEQRLRKAIVAALDGGTLFELAASRLATELTGDSIATNILMLGYAAQKGLLPVSAAALEQAIRLNGSFVDGNLRTFALGRLAAHDPDALLRELGAPRELVPLATVDDVLASRTRLLTAYQSADYAKQYADFVADIRARVMARVPQDGERLVREVALTLARLMAYKDEYEVARLYTDPAFTQRLREQFSGDFKLQFHLAPPMLPGQDGAGRPKKRRFGAWMLHAFRLLAPLKVLRGTAFDPLGYTHERRLERRLIADYRALILDIVDRVDERNLSAAIELAGAAQDIAGYGPVKDANAKAYVERLPQLLAAFENPVAPPQWRAA
ncbi:indolepyruvate ferredoxin oxidoreductase family protein [Sinimarinibacterium flocculans]|uniref:Indolepyruvate ferredoxin oxidoreductase n=1 Tax=Sinimarinibacterium flocculans TaxID=985250 RepID=A0A318EJR8_9GAMM|nr:indolepyruvate ferredoxin oxidoreductase family protein [Sinimarinibacterium flocculans]PXV71335.1 indolepyruvate ferredoxin oxidoreductase [Sinimarinibacterium flocculans]